MSSVAKRRVLIFGSCILLSLIAVKAQFCGKPGSPYNGHFNPLKSQYNVSEIVDYSCDKPTHSLVGNKWRRCLQNESWDHLIPTCELNLALAKPNDANSPYLVDNKKDTFFTLLNGRSIQIDLQKEYSISYVILTLNPNAVYNLQIDVTSQQQKKMQCQIIKNKSLENVDTTFLCNNGYPIRGRYVAITEQSSYVTRFPIYEVGVFSVSEETICGDPDIPSHGSVVRNGNKSEFSCEENCILQGETTSWCVNGQWNTTGQYCVLKPIDWKGCGEPGTPNNGDRYIGGELQNQATYSCGKGSNVIGSSVRECLPNGTWSPQQIPRCVTNLAFNKMGRHQSIVSPKRVQSVDGNSQTCESQTDMGYIDLEEPLLFDRINILIRSNNLISVNVSVTNDSRITQTNYKDVKNMTNFCYVHDVRLTKALNCTHQLVLGRYLAIYLNIPANVCEIFVYNSNEQTPCGQPDQPLNGRMKSMSPNITTFECNFGYTLKGSSSIRCVDGVWKPNTPQCEPIFSPTVKPTIAPWKTSVDPIYVTTGTHEHDENKNDSVAMGIMGIAVGATAACVAIILVSFLVYCFVRKHYKNRSRCDHDHSSRGSRSDCYTTTYRLPERRREDEEDASIHLYDSIKEPNYSFSPRRLPDTVSNDLYDAGTLNSNHSSEQRHRLLPERPPLYDTVTPEIETTPNDNRVKLPIPETDDPLLDCENKPRTSL